MPRTRKLSADCEGNRNGSSSKYKGARLSAQKARLVADQVRGKAVEEALNILTFSPKKAAVISSRKFWSLRLPMPSTTKVLDVDELKVSTIFVDEGMTMKRIKPRAKGRADRILKRTCHITVKVADK